MGSSVSEKRLRRTVPHIAHAPHGTNRTEFSGKARGPGGSSGGPVPLAAPLLRVPPGAAPLLSFRCALGRRRSGAVVDWPAVGGAVVVVPVGPHALPASAQLAAVI